MYRSLYTIINQAPPMLTNGGSPVGNYIINLNNCVMINEEGKFVLEIGLKPSKDYEAIARPNRDKNGFIEIAKSNRYDNLEYVVLDLKPERQYTKSGLEKVAMREFNPTVCAFSEWNKTLFDRVADRIEDDEPDPKRSFRTKLAVGGAFYSAPAKYSLGDNQWDNVLLFVPEDDNAGLGAIEKQFKFQFRSLLIQGAVFEEADPVMEWLADILVDYALPEPEPQKPQTRGRRK